MYKDIRLCVCLLNDCFGVYDFIIVCGGKLNATDKKQYMKSVNYPAENAPSQDCQWEITVPHGNFIKFTFENLNLNCTNDYIELSNLVSNKQKSIARLCSTQGLATSYHSSGTRMLVKFYTEGNQAYQGFKGSFIKGVLVLLD